MVARRLGELEAAVMARLWARDEPATVREILVELRPQRALAYTTVMTVLDALHRKGVANRVMDGRAYRYTAGITAEQYTAQLVGAALADAPDRAAVLVRFIDELSAAEVAQLREALDGRGASTPARRGRRG